MQFYYRVHWHLLRLLVRSYFRLSIQGCEHIPSTGPVLLASNHASYLDPPLIALAIPRQINFLAKEELFSVPVMNWWIRWMGALPIDRSKGDMHAIRLVLNAMKSGKALLVFPEGTRCYDGTLQPLEPGLAWFSMKSGAPVVPLYISGTFEAMPRGVWIPRPRKVAVRVGPGLYPNANPGEKVDEERIRQFTNEIAWALRNLAEESIS